MANDIDLMEQEFDNYQQMPQQQPLGMMPVPRRMDADFVKSLYDTDEVLESIENFLRGKIKNDNGKYEDKHKPLLNSEGVNILMGDLKMRIHKVGFLSNLSKDDVKRVCKELRKMIINWVYLNWQKFDVDKSNATRIVYGIDHPIFLSLMKSLNDGERAHLFPTTSRQENVMIQSEQPRQKKFGIF